MKRIKIFAKNTGIGNQIQFIPFIQWMVKSGYNVITDSKVLPQLTECREDNESSATINFIVYGHSFWNMLSIIRLTTIGRIYHFAPILRGVPLKLKNGIVFNFNVMEVINNTDLLYLFTNDETLNDYSIERTAEMIPNKVIIGATLRPLGLGIDKYKELIYKLNRTGHIVRTVDDCIVKFSHKETPTITDLRRELSTAEYYIGTDTGVTHLADILGLKVIVVWGSNFYTKSKPVNNHKVLHKALDCQPCSKNGQTNCNDFKCMDFNVDEIIREL